MDRIDPLFYARSNRIDLKDETRIKATSEEASEWAAAQQDSNGGYNFQLEDDSSIIFY
jgi:ubiquitin conjugation factor E4 B